MRLAGFLFSFALMASSAASAQIIWDADHLNDVKNRLDEPLYRSASASLYAKADSLLSVKPLSVMDKQRTAASGDKHDYLSQARYFWPNEETDDGLPYVNRDGVTNPEINKLDRIPLGLTAERVSTLALAYFFSGDEKYAAKAAELLKVWFLNPATRMNANLEYAQIVPGQNGDKGRCYGVLDGYSFVEMLEGVYLLEGSKAWSVADNRGLQQWFGRLAHWMETSPQGKEESRQANNHSTVYDAELAAFSAFAGNTELARKVLGEVAKKRIATQIRPDGSQPEELWRTLAFGYSVYNLEHLVDLVRMGRSLGVDIPLDKAPAAGSGSILDGLNYLRPYAGRGAKAWPHQQISGKAEKDRDLARLFYRTALLLPENKDLMQAYYDTRIFEPADRFHLLYTDATPLDNEITDAAPHLRLTIAEATKRLDTDNTDQWARKVAPYTVTHDGQLVMIDPRHWCSGFFAGSLWQMYDYTNDPYWRTQAEYGQSLMEEAKTHRGTHDLGFMMYDTFGQGYNLTGDTHMKDVVIESAETLSTRYSPKVKSIRSWDHNTEVWKYPVIIDNMMNLELLFRASELTGDPKYRDIAVNHANTTLSNHFRPDYSSYHVVDYDPETGAVRMKVTAQGYSDDSFWSRGQAWGLYGFTAAYRYTGDRRYLDHARHIADFIMALPDMPDDLVPYWDMKAPGVGTPEAAKVPRDASAAAVTASGLYYLADYVEPAEAERYRAYADRILTSLTDSYRIPQGEKFGFLLDHSTGHLPANDNIDVPLNYADYYYLEALGRQTRAARR